MKEKMYRTLLSINDIRDAVIDVCIPAWNPGKAVSLPAASLPEEITPHVGMCLFAQVNIGAEKASDLRFAEFEPAGEIDENDGLA